MTPDTKPVEKDGAKGLTMAMGCVCTFDKHGGLTPYSNAYVISALENYDALKQRVKVLEEALGKIMQIRADADSTAINRLYDIQNVAEEALAPPVGEKEK